MSTNKSSERNGTNATPTTNGSTPVNPPRDLVTIEQDISRLSSIFSGSTLSEVQVEEELDEASLAELFKQLEGATGLMNGVEDKLDNILGNLDNLLAALEEKNAKKEQMENVEEAKTTDAETRTRSDIESGSEY